MPAIEKIEPKGIIVHSMSEYVLGLCAADSLARDGYSVHALIHPNGFIENTLEPNYRAVHAGISEHNGLTQLNDHYLGVEVLVKGNNSWSDFVEKTAFKEAYTSAQYRSLGQWCKTMATTFKIPLENIVGHSDVSGDDIRGKGLGKIDPNTGFDWQRFWICYNQWDYCSK